MFSRILIRIRALLVGVLLVEFLLVAVLIGSYGFVQINCVNLEKFVDPPSNAILQLGSDNDLIFLKKGQGLLLGQYGGYEFNYEVSGYPHFIVIDNNAEAWIFEKADSASFKQLLDFLSWRAAHNNKELKIQGLPALYTPANYCLPSKFAIFT